MRRRGESWELGARNLRALVAGGIIVLLAGAAAGSGALRQAGQPGPDHRAGILLVVFFAVVPGFAIAIGAWVQALNRRNFGGSDNTEPRWTRRDILRALAVLLVALIGAFVLLVSTGKGTEPDKRPPLITTVPTQSIEDFTATTSPPKPPADSLDLQWWMAAGALLLVGAMGAGFVLLNSHRSGPALSEADRDVRPDPTIVRQAVEESIDALEHESDARESVIAAFVRMERVFAMAGLPAISSETPFEYVDRCLLHFGAEVSTASDLASLFEEAKFSSHDVGEDKRAAALNALRSLRLELGITT